MIKLLALDWNGTLISDTVLQWRSANKTFVRFGMKAISLKRFQETYDIPILTFWKANGGKGGNQEKEQAVYHSHYEPGEAKLRSRGGCRELLNFAHKAAVTTAIFSNHPSEHIRRQLKRLKLDHYPITVLGRDTNDQSHISQRSKEARLTAFVKKHKFKPAQIMCVGDTGEEVDIAKDKGYYSVALTGGAFSESRLKKLKPNFLVHNLRSIPKIIKSLHE